LILNYDGKGKTDHLEEDDLEGKGQRADQVRKNYDGKGKTDHLEEDDLEGKGQRADQVRKNYDGKGKTDHLEEDDLEGKGQRADQVRKNYDGKGKTDHLEEDDLEGKGERADQVKKNYDGKGKTDHLEEDDLKGRAQKEEGIDSHYDNANTLHKKAKKDPPSYEAEGDFTPDVEPSRPRPVDESGISNPFAKKKKKEAALSEPLMPETNPHASTPTPEGGHPDAPVVDPRLASPELDQPGATNQSNASDPRLNPVDSDETQEENTKTTDPQLQESSQKDAEKLKPNGAVSSEQDGDEKTEGEALDPRLGHNEAEDIAKKTKGSLKGGVEESFNPMAKKEREEKEKKTAEFGAKRSDAFTPNHEKKQDELEDILSGGLTDGAKKAREEAKAREAQAKDLKEKLDAKGLNKEIKNANDPQAKEDLDLDKTIDGKRKEQASKESNLRDINAKTKKEASKSNASQKEAAEKEVKEVLQEPKLNLESGEVKVVIKQKTDKGNDISFLCGFDDLFEDELVVNAPKDSLLRESHVAVSVTLKYGGKKVVIKTNGAIEEIEEHDNYKDKLIIRLKDLDKKKVENFMNLYQERQSSINEFMEMAKGY
jgi:hypothetical protein